MSELLCVTNRKLCRGNFPERVETLAVCRPRGIILREKDLPEQEYKTLAFRVMAVCKARGVSCILHSFVRAALALDAPALHVPMHILRDMGEGERKHFKVLGASCHSAEEAREAETLGCTYITAGHIFSTGCKPGLPPRGLEFLSGVCGAVSIPVYAIGGIGPDNISAVLAQGAAGVCVMSGAMECADPAAYFAAFERAEGDR